ncbi:hypothetical protein BS47DRAFT_1381687 [Hydnum rufescens UP504]|uniref:GDP/GTP exchange factor Sec2 N-terminal domain-containing protein n=1 Tax=Hydnum rufescens UP504 TaxID=1448309 RepID=A0A9P6B0C5_9AGAM|nr:hypothetical protein BS47DRAFT_1381687 [Hydnum rufescens UP504]
MGDVSAPQDVARTLANDANDVPQIMSFSNSHSGRETFGETLESVEVDDLLLQAKDVLSRPSTEENPRELRELAERLVDKVKVLVKALSRLEETRDELQTSLTVTSSNLTLALSNTEMLEEALKRAGGGGGKDLGWRRWSDREGAGLLKRSSASVSFSSTATVPEHDDHFSGKRAYINGTESEASNSRGASPTPTISARHISILAPLSSSGNATARVQGSHLVSASLPSLAATIAPGLFPPGDNTSRDDVSDSQSPVSPTDQYKQRVEELEKLLASEREARDEALAGKTKIEGEVENLTAVLFEEANKMVAMERKRVAEVEEELQIAQDEREALRGALKVVELENLGRKEKEEHGSLQRNENGIVISRVPLSPSKAREKALALAEGDPDDRS